MMVRYFVLFYIHIFFALSVQFQLLSQTLANKYTVISFVMQSIMQAKCDLVPCSKSSKLEVHS
jgi:hypothetical protein